MVTQQSQGIELGEDMTWCPPLPARVLERASKISDEDGEGRLAGSWKMTGDWRHLTGIRDRGLVRSLDQPKIRT